VSVHGTLVEDEMRRFKGECVHFSFNKCPIYTRDSASSTNSHETDNSAYCTRTQGAQSWVLQTKFSQLSPLSRGAKVTPACQAKQAGTGFSLCSLAGRYDFSQLSPLSGLSWLRFV
jgi:hypothetical protein